MAIDWEGDDDHPPYALLRYVVRLFITRRSFFPVLYAGHLLREQREIVLGDALLAKCPLWYSRYDTEDEARLQIPHKTWPVYTLWQFTDEKRGFGKPFPPSVIWGGDFSRFRGDRRALAAAWPFRVKASEDDLN